VALLTEGTYPYVDGGVSTWAHSLCHTLTNVEYSIYAVTGHTAALPAYPRTPNTAEIVQLPQWGTEDIVEYVQRQVRGAAYFRRKLLSRLGVSRFLEDFARLVDVVLEPAAVDPIADGELILRLHRFFQDHDYTSVFRRRSVWQCFEERCLSFWRKRMAAEGRPEPSALQLAVALRWMHNLLSPLALPIPNVDVIHASVGAIVGLIGAIGKMERGIPFVLTEHGVYLRERHISLSSAALPWFHRRIMVGLSSVASRICYAYADRVTPVCAYNTRWETRLGVPPDRIQVIYNGIDPEIFRPGPKPEAIAARPTVVAAARVSPIKDVLSMIEATAVARRQVPNLLVRVYGSLTADPPYVELCRQRIVELGLEDTFELAGFHSSPAEIYNEGDISVLSSITEAFPYTVLESMACQRPVVATDVGGVAEALEGYGIVVPPKDPESLGSAMAELLRDAVRRSELGRRGREQVLTRFHIDTAARKYLDLYRSVTASGNRTLHPVGLSPLSDTGNGTAHGAQRQEERQLSPLTR